MNFVQLLSHFLSGQKSVSTMVVTLKHKNCFVFYSFANIQTIWLIISSLLGSIFVINHDKACDIECAKTDLPVTGEISFKTIFMVLENSAFWGTLGISEPEGYNAFTSLLDENHPHIWCVFPNPRLKINDSDGSKKQFPSQNFRFGGEEGGAMLTMFSHYL